METRFAVEEVQKNKIFVKIYSYGHLSRFYIRKNKIKNNNIVDYLTKKVYNLEINLDNKTDIFLNEEFAIITSFRTKEIIKIVLDNNLNNILTFLSFFI